MITLAILNAIKIKLFDAERNLLKDIPNSKLISSYTCKERVLATTSGLGQTRYKNSRVL